MKSGFNMSCLNGDYEKIKPSYELATKASLIVNIYGEVLKSRNFNLGQILDLCGIVKKLRLQETFIIIMDNREVKPFYHMFIRDKHLKMLVDSILAKECNGRYEYIIEPMYSDYLN